MKKILLAFAMIFTMSVMAADDTDCRAEKKVTTDYAFLADNLVFTAPAPAVVAGDIKIVKCDAVFVNTDVVITAIMLPGIPYIEKLQERLYWRDERKMIRFIRPEQAI